MKEIFLHRLIVTAAALVLGEVPCVSSAVSSCSVREVSSPAGCNSIFSDMSLYFQVVKVFQSFSKGLACVNE